MAIGVWRRIKQWERRYRAGYTHRIDTPEERRKSKFFTDWVDHGILRYRWHNFAQVAPGLFRSNHPNHVRLEAYAGQGIRTILNLRGKSDLSHHRFEAESCAALGLRLIDLPLSARSAPTRARLCEILDTLDALDGPDAPTLMHCKSGADRTGLVSAIYLIHCLGEPVDAARRMLSIRFLHLKFSKTGILDYVLHQYATRTAAAPISFRDWAETEYDIDAATAGFAKLGFFARLRL